MVLAKKVSISSDPANVLLSYPNACLSNICSMNMRSFFDCSKNAISYKAKNGRIPANPAIIIPSTKLFNVNFSAFSFEFSFDFFSFFFGYSFFYYLRSVVNKVFCFF